MEPKGSFFINEMSKDELINQINDTIDVAGDFLFKHPDYITKIRCDLGTRKAKISANIVGPDWFKEVITSLDLRPQPTLSSAVSTNLICIAKIAAFIAEEK